MLYAWSEEGSKPEELLGVSSDEVAGVLEFVTFALLRVRNGFAVVSVRYNVCANMCCGSVAGQLFGTTRDDLVIDDLVDQRPIVGAGAEEYCALR